ncbi:prolyl-tRNA synthetase associated domain-containing protein [Acidobacteriota bacterium]
MTDKYEQDVYDVLDELNISYIRHEHPPVYTINQAEQHWANTKGAFCKNLFLRNKKGTRHYLVILEYSKKADIKAMTERLNEDRLSFASPERLRRYLGLLPGAVSPFGLINDNKREVRVVIDKDLKKTKWISFHPNVNTSTVRLSFADFERFLAGRGNIILYYKF